MITIFRKRIFSTLSVLGIALSVLLSGCGGSSSDKTGHAPESIVGYELQLIFGPPDSGYKPTMLNVYDRGPGSSSFGYTSTEYQAQVAYTKTGENTGAVSINTHTPEIGTPWTITYLITADMIFNEDGVTGTITNWTYTHTVADNVAPTVITGNGSSGNLVLNPL